MTRKTSVTTHRDLLTDSWMEPVKQGGRLTIPANTGKNWRIYVDQVYELGVVNGTPGRTIFLRIEQDPTGHSLTFDGSLKTTPSVSSAASAVTWVTLVYDDVAGSWEPVQPSLAAAWPVGSIFISAVATSPATLLGFGTWSQIGAGRVLVGLDGGDPDFTPLGTTGGSKTVASVGSNSVPTFTGSALAPHTHTVTSNVSATVNEPNFTIHASNAVIAAGVVPFADRFNGTTLVAGDNTVNNPAQTVTVTNNAVTSGATSGGTPAGTVSASVYTGTATSIVQPYLVVALWQRTA